MTGALRFTAALVLGLGLVTWMAWGTVQQTTRPWFEKDLQLRAELAVRGARQALVSDLRSGDTPGLGQLLEEIARDERVMGAALCTVGTTMLARTAAYPAELSCEKLTALLAIRLEAATQRSWDAIEALREGNVHVSGSPLFDGDRPLGFVALVHDLSFIERREDKTAVFLLLSFVFLALSASAVTVIAARLSFRNFRDELRRLLRGGAQRPEFQPIMRDVRELVEEIVVAREVDREGGAWTPERLKQILIRHLHGERVVVLANREPYIHERNEDGHLKVVHPASGLVTALEPVMRACSGVWIAHGSGTADRDTVDRHDRVRVPPGEEYLIRRVWLSSDEEKGYYYGFSNEGLWPLCHIAHTRPVFRRDDFKHYQHVNEKFANAVCDEVDSDDPIILVQDYHFALAPRIIRKRLPRSTIIMSWHVPWPNSERFGICPWDKELLEGMLGSSILGFHTQTHCNNFVDSVDRFLECRIDREQHAVVRGGRTTLVRPYPISIDWPNPWARAASSIDKCRASVFAELELDPDMLLGVGVDRLDYTKGVEERLLAVERLLERFVSLRGKFVFAQLAAPSRTIIERYRQLNETIERLANRINERFGRIGYRPIVLLRAHHEPPTVFRFYRAADLCYVSSLHDGMNLVAKEFVAAREDEQGVLVLSQFTGAARELTEALIVNPYDLEEASSALAKALTMSPEEQRERIRSMRAFLSEFNVYRWGGRMLADAARLRSRERLSGRLTAHLAASPNGQ